MNIDTLKHAQDIHMVIRARKQKIGVFKLGDMVRFITFETIAFENMLMEYPNAFVGVYNAKASVEQIQEDLGA